MSKVEILRGTNKNTGAVSSSRSAGEGEIGSACLRVGGKAISFLRKGGHKKGSGESASECELTALGSDEKILEGKPLLLG